MESILSPVRWLESEIAGDFEIQQRQHAGRIEAAKVAHEAWQRNAREMAQLGDNIPAMPTDAVIPEPLVKPRVCISDATPEAVARILTGSPRGVLLTRDELSGWLASFGRYEGSGRAFWTEAYGAKAFTVDRVKHEKPLRIERLSVSVVGGIQPAKLEPLFNDADDGFAARFLWLWPEPRPFSRSRQAVDREQIRTAFWRLYSIEMAVKENGEPCPQVLPLSDEANDLLEVWCLEHDKERGSGLFQSALGKMRGQLLRLALVLEHIWWAVDPNSGESPTYIGENAVSAAADLMTNYFKPMCARVYGDAALPEIDRNTAALARWIVKERPTIINARTLRRDTPPTPQLRQPKAMEEAIQMLVDTNWLTHAPGRLGGRPGRARADYVVNPLIWERLPAQ